MSENKHNSNKTADKKLIYLGLASVDFVNFWGKRLVKVISISVWSSFREDSINECSFENVFNIGFFKYLQFDRVCFSAYMV